MVSHPYAELIDLARRALKAGDHFEAAGQFHRAALAARRDGMANECAYALRHCAIAEIENGKFEKALRDGKEALEIYGSQDDTSPLNTANTLRLIALAHEGLGHSADAEECWKAARDIYQSQDVPDGVSECDAHLEKAG